jgi:hypothetical protein
VTKQADVSKVLGPPSQIIALGDEVVYYYMREYKTGRALILLFYNQLEKDIEYDRAIFIFDKNGVLKQYSYSPESQPYESNEPQTLRGRLRGEDQ